MQYFDVEAKVWKLLPSLAPATEVTNCSCAVLVGSKLFVGAGAYAPRMGWCIYCYDVEKDAWARLPSAAGEPIMELCTVGNFIYQIPAYDRVPHRYNLAECRWQRFSEVNAGKNQGGFYKSGATVLQSKVYALYGRKKFIHSSWEMQNAELYCFDPLKNEWGKRATTCHPHFDSWLFVASGKICVAGGYESINGADQGCGYAAKVEVYDKEGNVWSVVKQSRIPPNNLRAVEVEGRVYFNINKFPVDSGIRIPPGEVYPINLDDWKHLGSVDRTAALCYVPVKRTTWKVD